MPTFADLADQVARRGNETALVCGGDRLSGRETVAQARRLGRALLADGIGRGDRVCLWLPNSVAFVLWELATTLVGAVVVPIHTRYGATELRNIVRQARPKLLVHSARFLGMRFDAILADAVGGAPELPDDVGDRVVRLEEDRVGAVLDAETFAAAGAATAEADLDAAVAALRPEDGAVCIFTSGTTGTPKGALLSHGAILTTERDVGDILGIRAGDRVLYAPPMASVFGCCNALVASWTHDACLVLLPTFEAGAALDAIEREGCGIVYGVPTMYLMMLAHPAFRPERTRSLRGGIVGGAPCSPQLADAIIGRLGMRDLVSGYGMSETCAVISATRIGDPVALVTTSVGRPIPGCEVEIRDPAGPEVRAAGQEGEICVRGSNLMLGYAGADGLASSLASPFDEEGWFRTGDLGERAPDGNLRITGRVSDMILVGGFNVYPVEVENLLAGHPAVAQAHVVGIPDDRLGERAIAFVQLSASATPVDLGAYCAGKIAKYKIPASFHVVDAFPMTPLGKVQKFELRKIAEELRRSSQGGEP